VDEQSIKNIIKNSFSNADIQVEGDGYHYTLRVIMPEFQDKSRMQRQQLIYRLFAEQITNGSLHALSIKTYTPDEWAQQK